MRCPFCQHPDDKVVDSREGREGDAIRRRRECLACGRRFTTYERVDAVMPLIVKKDGRREPYDRGKVLAGLHKACEKRPISADTIEEVATEVERRVQESGAREVPSSVVGEAIMSIAWAWKESMFFMSLLSSSVRSPSNACSNVRRSFKRSLLTVHSSAARLLLGAKALWAPPR